MSEHPLTKKLDGEGGCMNIYNLVGSLRESPVGTFLKINFARVRGPTMLLCLAASGGSATHSGDHLAF